MKSHIKMLELVKDKAESMGIRSYNGWYGIYATEEEIKKIYAANMFNVSAGRTVHKRHVENWELIGEAAALDMEIKGNNPFVVFFAIPPHLTISFRDFGAKSLLGPERGIEQVTWPYLVEKGLRFVADPEGESDGL